MIRNLYLENRGMNKNIYQYDKKKVSIVTPVYNGESHLSRMLDSVLNQTYGQIDMILVDDGSTDGTVNVAESYYDRFLDRGYGFRIVRAKHRCASAAINQGLLYVTGEFLIWPDSDDVLEPESVQRRVDFLQQHLQYNCVRSLSYYFNAETGELSDRADEKRGDLLGKIFFGISWNPRHLSVVDAICCGRKNFLRFILTGIYRSIMWGRIFRCCCLLCISIDVIRFRNSFMVFL